MGKGEKRVRCEGEKENGRGESKEMSGKREEKGSERGGYDGYGEMECALENKLLGF